MTLAGVDSDKRPFSSPTLTGFLLEHLLDRRRLFPIFIIVFVNFLGSTIVLPTLQLYASRHFNAPDQLIPLLNASYFAAQFLASPFLGRLSDKYGRVPVLIVSQIGTVLSFLLMGMAGNLQMLFFARILDGITGGNVIVAQAYITDVTTRKERTRALGLTFLAFGIGYTIGPALGGLLTAFGETVPFFAGAVISLVTVIITWLMLDETRTAEERLARREHQPAVHIRDLMHNTSLMLVLVIAFAAQFSMSLMNSTIVLYGEEVVFPHQSAESAALGIGIMLGMIGVGQFLTQIVFIKPVIERLGERRTVILGSCLRGFGLLSLAMFSSPYLVGGVSLMAFAVGSGLMMPSLQSLTTTCVSEDICGNVLGIYNSSTSLGVIAGSTLSGVLYAALPSLPYLTGGLIYVIVLIPAFYLLRQGRLEVAPQAVL